MKRFVLFVSQSNGEIAGCDYFVVEVSPSYARLLLDRLALLEAAKVKDADAYELWFWDATGDYFDGDPDAHSDSAVPSRTECNQLVVREAAVWWFAYPKHADVQLLTDPVSINDLRAIARA